jgi:wobble nucleotide-excising tRNase
MSIELYEYKINNLEKELSNYKNKLKHLKIKETTLSQVINKYKQKLSLFSRFLEIKLNEKSKIEKMLTNLVNEVFDKNDELKLELTYDKDESLKGIKCLVSSDGENFGPILDSYGEGEVTVVVLILYFLLLMVNNNVPKIIVFDEPLAFLNKSKFEVVNDFIKSVVKNTGIQVITLTHQDNPIGRLVKVDKTKGTSVISIDDSLI